MTPPVQRYNRLLKAKPLCCFYFKIQAFQKIQVLFTCTLFILGILGMPDVAIASDQGLVYELDLGSFFRLFISCLTPDFFSASKRI